MSKSSNIVQLVGYHGTNSDCANKIISSKTFTANKRDDHWLGQGVYFYDDLEIAKWWAEKKIESKKDFNGVPTIIETIIKVLPDELFDFHNNKNKDAFIDFVLDLLSKIKLADPKLHSNLLKKNHKSECFFYDYFKNEYGYKVLKQTFLKERTSYGKYDLKETYGVLSSFNNFKYEETQICISDNSVIDCCKII